jgi:hypothetical protein
MDDPLDIGEISPDVIDVLRKVGYKDDEELSLDLQSRGHSMAKVFCFMLTTRSPLEMIDWAQCNGGAFADGSSIMCEGEQSDYVLNPSDPFHRDSAASPESLSSVHSLAVRHEWDIPAVLDARILEKPREMRVNGMSTVDVMFGMQQLLRQRAMQWMHPDEFTILARHEGVGLLVTFQIGLASQQYVIAVQIQCWRGTPESFDGFCHAVQEKFAGNLT